MKFFQNTLFYVLLPTIIFSCSILFVANMTSAAASLSSTTSNFWTPTTPLGSGLMSHRAVTVALGNDENYVLVLGGITGSNTVTDKIYYARIRDTGTLDSWQELSTSLPVPLAVHTAVTRDNNIFVIGGWNGTARQSTVWRASIEKNGEDLVVAGDTWQKAGDYPRKIWFHSTIVVGNYLYVLGGLDENDQDISEVFYADISTSSYSLIWQQAPSLPEDRFCMSAVVHNERIYVLGGDNGAGAKDTVYYTAVDSSSGVLGAWHTNPQPMPKPLYYSEAVSYGNKLMVLGGKDRDQAYNDAYLATFSADGTLQWYTEQDSDSYDLPLSLYNFTVVSSINESHNSMTHVIGGNHDGNLQSQVYFNHSTFYYFPYISTAQ